ncbi:MAG: ketopantoate reductase family protein [Victivallaceae bacterium]
MLRPAIHSPETSLLMIQNGIGVEPQVAAAFPKNPVYGAIAYIGVRRDGANRILHQGAGRFLFGKYGEKTITPEALALSKLYASVNVEARPVESLDFIRWQKLLWNAPFNTVSVLGGGLTTNEMTDRGRIEQLCREIMLEVITTASAEGVELPVKMIDDNIEYTRNFPPYKSSMLIDFEAGRPLEIDAIVGNVIKIADRHGIAVPRLKTIEALLWARQMKN